MRVISVNLNGIRAAGRKGFYAWLEKQDADVICMQETKAQMDKLDDELYRPAGYHCAFHDAIRPGYSGVGIYSRIKPKKVTTGLGWPCADDEGRYIQFDFPTFSVASIYLPSGSSGDHRQEFKEEFLESFLPLLKGFRRRRRPFILCGDLNIVHREIDIRNFRQNQKTSGCLPHERAWLDEVFDEVGLVDAFRVVEPGPDHYTWWSNRGQAWAKNVGWRIDYQVITPNLKSAVRGASIYKDERFSDHAPLIIDYDFAVDE